MLSSDRVVIHWTVLLVNFFTSVIECFVKVFRDFTYNGFLPSENTIYIYLITLEKITIYINNTIRQKTVENGYGVIFQK